MPRATPLLIIDWAGFGKRVKAEMRALNLSCRDVEEATLIGFTQVARVQRGECVLRADVYLTLCRHLAIDPVAYAREPVRSEPSISVQRVEPTEAHHA
jgi:hypothetical protein